MRGPLCTGTLGLFGAWAGEASAKNCKKIKNKQKRKKCLKKGDSSAPTTACTPNCDRKICGSDGCGGSCGTCAGNEICQDGICVCVPNCTERVCGSDGCTGSCGGLCSVAGQNCTDAGQCVCPTQFPDVCGGACVAACAATEARNPGACGCCLSNGQFCDLANNQCCSGFCFDGAGFFDTCGGLAPGAECDFDAQCASGKCAPVFCPVTGCDHLGVCE